MNAPPTAAGSSATSSFAFAGKVLFTAYQDDNMQKRQAVEGFDKKLMEAIVQLKERRSC